MLSLAARYQQIARPRSPGGARRGPRLAPAVPDDAAAVRPAEGL